MATPTPDKAADKKDRSRKSPPFADIIKSVSQKLDVYLKNADWQKEDKVLNIENLMDKMQAQVEILQLLAMGMALPDLDTRGHEQKPATDWCGRTRLTAGQAHIKYKKELREYLSGKMKETEFSDFSGVLTTIRSDLRRAYDEATNMLKSLAVSREALERQRELYSEFHSDEIDEELKREEERIKKAQERLQTLKNKKEARGRKKAQAKG